MKYLFAAACMLGIAGIAAILLHNQPEHPQTAELHELARSEASPTGCLEQYQQLRALRMQRLTDLEEYAEAGRFPINNVRSGLASVFVDERGVACAVGHLMRCAGATELVDEVQRTNNLVRLNELHDGPVVEWIRTSGLTKEECELIQPSYWRGRGGAEPEPDPYPDPPQPVLNHTSLIQDRLRAVARKLRADTPASLRVALGRLPRAATVTMEWIAPGQVAHRTVRNETAANLLVRFECIDRAEMDCGQGEPGPDVTGWRVLAPGQSVNVPIETGGYSLLEVRPA